MDCSCNCSCTDHEKCGCQSVWCDCIIKNKIRKRKWHHKKVLETGDMMSLSGFFQGQICEDCGMVGRISEFTQVHENTTDFLEKDYLD